MADSITPLASKGLHHVTAVTDDAQGNLDFHLKVLGLRLVKLTVNFDDPGTHHLYYGDDVGRPGSALTYFPWTGIGRGRAGAGETQATALAVPVGSLGYWSQRLAKHGIRSTTESRFGRDLLALTAPDGIRLELAESPGRDGFVPARGTDVPPEHAIAGFQSVTLRSRRPEKTMGVLTELFGFRVTESAGERTRLVASSGEGAGIVDVVAAGAGESLAELGSGSVHHVAFRSSGEDHLRFMEKVGRAGHRITPPQERVYFRSLYFREPGGTLFEIATDDPGFTVDESAEALGSSLRLPPWLEPNRAAIESALPRLVLPGRTRVSVPN